MFILSALKLIGALAVLGLGAVTSAVQASFLIDDHFDDGNINTNTTGISGFSYLASVPAATATESGTVVSFDYLGLGTNSWSSINSNITVDPSQSLTTRLFFDIAGTSLPSTGAAGTGIRSGVGLAETASNFSLYNGSDMFAVELSRQDGGFTAPLQGGILMRSGGSWIDLAVWDWDVASRDDGLSIQIDLTDTTYGVWITDASFNLLSGSLSGALPSALPSSMFVSASTQSNQRVANVTLNRITAETVPIPAAAWLFGSALLGLGVIRRKKVA